MPIYDFFRNIFGLRDNNRNNYNDEHDNMKNHSNNDFFERTWRDNNESGEDRMGFNIFSDPIEIHRYFEHQMNEILHSFFHFGSFGADFNNGPSLMPPPESSETNTERKNLRDYFVKPKNNSETSRSDTDLDGKVNIDQLDDLLKDKSKTKLVPFDEKTSVMPRTRMFGQSITSKTIRRSDGTIESHHTVKDNEGNEQTTITKQIGDKRYKITVKTDKNGVQEKVEDMINIDEKELPRFMEDMNPKTHQQDDPNQWFPFDKFFK